MTKNTSSVQGGTRPTVDQRGKGGCGCQWIVLAGMVLLGLAFYSSYVEGEIWLKKKQAVERDMRRAATWAQSYLDRHPDVAEVKDEVLQAELPQLDKGVQVHVLKPSQQVGDLAGVKFLVTREEPGGFSKRLLTPDGDIITTSFETFIEQSR